MHTPQPLFSRGQMSGPRGQPQERHKGSCRLFHQPPAPTNLKVQRGPHGGCDILLKTEIVLPCRKTAPLGWLQIAAAGHGA